MTLEAFIFLGLFQTALSAIVAIVSLFNFRKRDKSIVLVGLAFLISFIINLTSFVLGKLQLSEYVNTPQLIYLLANFGLLTLLYKRVLSKKGSGVFLFVFVSFALFAILNSVYVQKQAINSFSYVFQSLVIIIYAVIYFYKLMVEMPAQHIQHLPMFWFNSAFIIFHAGTFFLFAFTSYLINVLKNDLLTYWTFHNALSIVEHLIVFIGLYYDLKNLVPTKA